MVKFVLFDLDGTLMDTAPGLIATQHRVLSEMGFEILPDEVLNSFIGPPLPLSYRKHYNMSDDEIAEALRLFRAYYPEEIIKSNVYPGVLGLCKSLKALGLRLGVATYKQKTQADVLMEHFGFDEYMDSVHGSNPAEDMQKTDIIRACVEDMGFMIKDGVMIGDSTFDSDAATAVSIPFIGVTYGFGFKTKADLADIPHMGVADTAEEVLEIIKNSLEEA